MTNLLANIAWHSLAGPHASYAAGTGRARRYARGFAPIVAFADTVRPDFSGLIEFCNAEERFYCDGWIGAAPLNWRIDDESMMFRMLWSASMPVVDPAPAAVRLDRRHAAQAVELAALTTPGPFGPRTLELGDYFGVFDGPQLVAMAGERMQAGGLREISGVCTHPEFQGRGLARALVRKLVRLQLMRKQRPFLNVMRENVSAHRLYKRIGFVDIHESVVRVIAPIAAARA